MLVKEESIELGGGSYESYISVLLGTLRSAQATGASGETLQVDGAIRDIGRLMRAAHDSGRRILLIGNGGSAGICSHMATDLSKNGSMRATALNDSSALTCLGNDYGYDQVFAKQIEWHATAGDVLVAISSSGRSANILNAIRAGRKKKCQVVTLSGFEPSNPLRSMGDINVYLPSREYGFVEVGHLAVMHATLDIAIGWNTSL